jgi:hypothetical protein
MASVWDVGGEIVGAGGLIVAVFLNPAVDEAVGLDEEGALGALELRRHMQVGLGTTELF